MSKIKKLIQILNFLIFSSIIIDFSITILNAFTHHHILTKIIKMELCMNLTSSMYAECKNYEWIYV